MQWNIFSCHSPHQLPFFGFYEDGFPLSSFSAFRSRYSWCGAKGPPCICNGFHTLPLLGVTNLLLFLSFTHSLTHRLTYGLTHYQSLSYSFTRPLTYSCTNSLTYPLTHSPAIYLTQSLTYTPTNSQTHSFNHSITHSYTH